MQLGIKGLWKFSPRAPAHRELCESPVSIFKVYLLQMQAGHRLAFAGSAFNGASAGSDECYGRLGSLTS